MTLGDLLEGVVLHAFEGKAPFSRTSIAKIAKFKELYGLDLTAADRPHAEGEVTMRISDEDRAFLTRFSTPIP